MPTTCFMIEPTDRGHRELRRFTFRDAGAEACPLAQRGYYGHDASTPIDDALLEISAQGIYHAWAEDIADDDPRWPTHCACGYAFTPDDERQVATERIYTAEDGQEYTLHPSRPDRPPAGAMWRSDWLEPEMAGPDGISLSVMLPGGYEWAIDGPSTSGGGWTRTGTPPKITANPSIKSPNYHGWLQDGVLSDDIDGRSPA